MLGVVLPRVKSPDRAPFRLVQHLCLEGARLNESFCAEVLEIRDAADGEHPVVLFLRKKVQDDDVVCYAEFDTIPNAQRAIYNSQFFQEVDKIVDTWEGIRGFLKSVKCHPLQLPWFYPLEEPEVIAEEPVKEASRQFTEEGVKGYLADICPRKTHNAEGHLVLAVPGRQDVWIAWCKGFNNRVFLVYARKGGLKDVVISGQSSTTVEPIMKSIEYANGELRFKVKSLRTTKAPDADVFIKLGAAGDADPLVVNGATDLF